jgi:hypothetical protein
MAILLEKGRRRLVAGRQDLYYFTAIARQLSASFVMWHSPKAR